MLGDGKSLSETYVQCIFNQIRRKWYQLFPLMEGINIISSCETVITPAMQCETHMKYDKVVSTISSWEDLNIGSSGEIVVASAWSMANWCFVKKCI